MQMSEHPQRVAIVTGGARGIGAAIAKRFAADGMAVAVIDLKEGDCAATVDAITAAGGPAFAAGADVSDSGAGRRGRRRDRRRARAADGARQQRRRDP